MADLIDRQAAIDEAEEWISAVYCERGGYRERDAIKHVISSIKRLPSARPEPRSEPEKGHWIPIDEDSDVYECDVCRTTYDTVCGTFDLPYFCPHCGADMRGDQNEND